MEVEALFGEAESNRRPPAGASSKKKRRRGCWNVDFLVVRLRAGACARTWPGCIVAAKLGQQAGQLSAGLQSFTYSSSSSLLWHVIQTDDSLCFLQWLSLTGSVPMG